MSVAGAPAGQFLRVAVVFAVLVAAVAGCKPQVAGGSADGAAVYADACASCHGPQGAPPPAMAASLAVRDLSDPAVQASLSDAQIREQILRGSDNRVMPAFGGALTDEQLEAVVRHVRTLTAGDSTATPR